MIQEHIPLGYKGIDFTLHTIHLKHPYIFD